MKHLVAINSLILELEHLHILMNKGNTKTVDFTKTVYYSPHHYQYSCENFPEEQVIEDLIQNQQSLISRIQHLVRVCNPNVPNRSVAALNISATSPPAINSTTTKRRNPFDLDNGAAATILLAVVADHSRNKFFSQIISDTQILTNILTMLARYDIATNLCTTTNTFIRTHLLSRFLTQLTEWILRKQPVDPSVSLAAKELFQHMIELEGNKLEPEINNYLDQIFDSSMVYDVPLWKTVCCGCPRYFFQNFYKFHGSDSQSDVVKDTCFPLLIPGDGLERQEDYKDIYMKFVRTGFQLEQKKDPILAIWAKIVSVCTPELTVPIYVKESVSLTLEFAEYFLGENQKKKMKKETIEHVLLDLCLIFLISVPELSLIDIEWVDHLYKNPTFHKLIEELLKTSEQVLAKSHDGNVKDEKWIYNACYFVRLLLNSMLFEDTIDVPTHLLPYFAKFIWQGIAHSSNFILFWKCLKVVVSRKQLPLLYHSMSNEEEQRQQQQQQQQPEEEEEQENLLFQAMKNIHIQACDASKFLYAVSSLSDLIRFYYNHLSQEHQLQINQLVIQQIHIQSRVTRRWVIWMCVVHAIVPEHVRSIYSQMRVDICEEIAEYFHKVTRDVCDCLQVNYTLLKFIDEDLSPQTLDDSSSSSISVSGDYLNAVEELLLNVEWWLTILDETTQVHHILMPIIQRVKLRIPPS